MLAKLRKSYSSDVEFDEESQKSTVTLHVVITILMEANQLLQTLATKATNLEKENLNRLLSFPEGQAMDCVEDAGEERNFYSELMDETKRKLERWKALLTNSTTADSGSSTSPKETTSLDQAFLHENLRHHKAETYRLLASNEQLCDILERRGKQGLFNADELFQQNQISQSTSMWKEFFEIILKGVPCEGSSGVGTADDYYMSSSQSFSSSARSYMDMSGNEDEPKLANRFSFSKSVDALSELPDSWTFQANCGTMCKDETLQITEKESSSEEVSWPASIWEFIEMAGCGADLGIYVYTNQSHSKYFMQMQLLLGPLSILLLNIHEIIAKALKQIKELSQRDRGSSSLSKEEPYHRYLLDSRRFAICQCATSTRRRFNFVETDNKLIVFNKNCRLDTNLKCKRCDPKSWNEKYSGLGYIKLEQEKHPEVQKLLKIENHAVKRLRLQEYHNRELKELLAEKQDLSRWLVETDVFLKKNISTYSDNVSITINAFLAHKKDKKFYQNILLAYEKERLELNPEIIELNFAYCIQSLSQLMKLKHFGEQIKETVQIIVSKKFTQAPTELLSQPPSLGDHIGLFLRTVARIIDR